MHMISLWYNFVSFLVVQVYASFVQADNFVHNKVLRRMSRMF